MFIDLYERFVSLFFEAFEDNAGFVVIFIVMPFLLILLHAIQYFKYRSDDDMSEKVLGSLVAFLFVPVVLSFLHELIIEAPVEIVE